MQKIGIQIWTLIVSITLTLFVAWVCILWSPYIGFISPKEKPGGRESEAIRPTLRWSQRRLRRSVFASGFGLAAVTGDVAQLLVVIKAKPFVTVLVTAAKAYSPWSGLFGVIGNSSLSPKGEEARANKKFVMMRMQHIARFLRFSEISELI